MSDYLFLAPVVFVGTLGAIVGLYLKFTTGDETSDPRITVAFDLSESQSEKLRKEADCLGIQPSDLARAALTDLLDGRDEDVRTAVARVLQRKVDLYKRPA